jgi:subtilisin family serine protease
MKGFMMRIMLSVWLLLSTLILPSECFAQDAKRRGERVRTVLRDVNNVIVRFDSNPDPLVGPLVPAESRFGGLPAKTQAVMGSLGAKISKTWCDGRVSLVTLGPGIDASVALERLRAMPQVRYAVPDDLVSLAEFVPNDPQFEAQWALRNTTDVDIDATLTWDQTTGSATTVVAVMDTGIDYTHPDLYLAVALNNVEIPSSLRDQLVDTNSDGQIDFYDLNSLDAAGDIALDGSGAKFNGTLL